MPLPPWYRRWLELLGMGLALLAVGGCATVVRQAMGEVKAPNRIFLHANPQPGDYALYENEEGSYQMRREVVAVDGDRVELQTTFPKTPAIIAAMRDVSFHSQVRRDGSVIQPFMHNAKTGATVPMMLAGPNDYGYLAENPFTALSVPETVTTRQGSTTVDKVVVFRQSVALPGVESHTTSVWYYDPHVKFGLVRQYNLTESDASIVEVAGFINRISPIGQLYRSLSSFLIERSRHHTYSSRMDLVESN